MKKNKISRILLIALAFVVASGLVFALTVFIRNETINNNYVTVTFDTNGGSYVEPIKVEKGQKLSSLPQSYLAGSSFDYWYIDEDLENEFKLDTEINSDITLFAGFKAINVDVNVTEATNTYVENVEQNHAIAIVSSRTYTAQQLLDTIRIEAITGYLPWNEADDLAEGLPKQIYGWYEVSHSGSVYTITPKKISFEGGFAYAYTPGQLYQVTITNDMHFNGLQTSIVQYTFRVKDTDKSTELDNVQYKNAENLCYVDKNDITNISQITEVSTETGKVEFTQDENGIYCFCFGEESAKKYNFAKDLILCIGDGKKLDVTSLFVKVVDVVERAGNGTLEYLVRAIDADISEVFNKIDVNYNEPIDSNDIINNLDTEEISEIIKTSGGLEKATTLMTNLLMVSDEVQSIYTAESTENNAKSNPGTGLPDFCYNAEIRNEATLLKIKLLEDAEVKVTLGNGHNPNFDSAYTDNFVALKITFSYETTIKNRLEVKAEISITQYLAASAQGYLDYDWGVFKLKWAEFDFAINLYSQTDIDFKILVRTVRENGNNNNNNNNNNKDDGNSFVDIADKIADKINSDEGDDPENLVAELKAMLDSEDGEIELFRAPILNIPIKIIPILPVMEVNVELDFLVTMNFAAGFSAHLSVLEAVQVGVTGSTKTKDITSYKYDNLPGGNQYALQLSACGYLGFKAGFEGGISVSFCGLSTLGRVGVWVYSGAYVDIYGFAQATLVKQNNIVSQSLVGGYYIEIGIFLDVKLEARSKLFGTKVGITLLSEKWPLVSFGNKEVLVSVQNKALEETVYIANNGENSASIKLDYLPKLTGTYIDITTGETYSKEIPWDKVTLKTSLNNFQYNPAEQVIDYYNYSTWRPASEECVATYYYDGPILQFNMSTSKYKDLCPFAQTKIVYYDESKVDKEDAGKKVTLKFYSLIDGEKELLEERTNVLAGSIIYSSSAIELDPHKYVNIQWDKIPWETTVTEDTEFVCSADLRQAYTAFIYYDATKDAWITDIRVSNLGEAPIAPEVPNSEQVTFEGWRGRNGLNNKIKNTPTSGVGPTITADDLNERGFFIGTTYGKDLTKSVASYETKGFAIGNHTDALLNSNNKSDEGICWYYTIASIYIEQYETEDCKITIHNYDYDGKEIIDEYYVEFNTMPTSYINYAPFSRELLGFAEEKDGEVIYESLFDIKNVVEDIELYAIYREITHSVNLYYYDIETYDYKLYKTVAVAGGGKLSSLGTDLEYIKNKDLVKEEGVETNFLRLEDIRGEVRTNLTDNTIFTRDLNIYPVWSRKVDVILSSGIGEFIHKDSSGNPITQEKVYTESKLNYKLTINSYCIKDIDDPKYCYKFVGWKNSVTGEEFKIKSNDNFEIETVCKTPTTYTAMFEYVERTDYNVKVKTEHGTIKDSGLAEINYNNITYDRFNELINEYNLWRPASYRDEEKHCTYNAYLNERKEGTTCTLEYRFTPTYDIVPIHINLNGGESKAPARYEKFVNSEIDLSKHTATRVDDYGTWKMSHWTDSKGNRYELNAKYLVAGEDTLTLHWTIDTYIDYKLTLELDGEEIGSTLYHKDDVLGEIQKPTQADGKVFSGWTWYNSKGQEIEALTKMPAENLTLKGTTSEVYVIYKVNDTEISKVVGRVGYEQTVRDAYVKEGHTVSAWTTTNASVVNGKFTMPENDVVFVATATINSYTVTYYHKNEIFGNVQTIDYGDYVPLANLPDEDGEFYAWVSDDVNLGEFGFTMPAKNVVIRTVASEVKQYIVYCVNDKIIDYKAVVPNKQEILRGTPVDLEYSGLEFSGWYIGNQSMNGKSSFVVPNETTYIYGYFTSGTTKVNIYFDEANTTPDLVMYGDVGDTIKITMKLANQEISGYKINGDVVNEIAISNTTDINAYVQYASKKYAVSYAESDFDLPSKAYYVAGERVNLANLPTGTSEQEIGGWFVAGVEILTDTTGNYFIMPERNVVVNLKLKNTTQYDSEYVTASTFITSPYNTEAVLYQQYKVYNNHSVVFNYPIIDGYEFVCWKDVNGNVVAHDKLSIDYQKMNGENCNFYADYRKLEVHFAEFRINNKIVALQEFYDSYEVQITTPVVGLEEYQAFTGWENLYITATTQGNTLTFKTGDRHTYEYAKKDFIFTGYIYEPEDSYPITIIYPDGEYKYYVNSFSEVLLDRYHNNIEVSYELSVSYKLNDGETIEVVVKNGVELNNGEFIVKIPDIYNYSNSLKTTDTDVVQIVAFTVRTTQVYGPELD